ncbi:hypothetical protein FGB62_73g034 [Gracilaria domingensis]|nr:hypothetical protein FGB62_373g012 [Gracilaria domingensis]KAI0561760.1 hypothetical protein FGB62_73g034 [Gracilaria domingensis]
MVRILREAANKGWEMEENGGIGAKVIAGCTGEECPALAPFLWPRSQTPAAEISDALQRLAQWPACHPCIRTCSATKMCSPCPLPLPPHLEEKVREEQRQFMDNMKAQANVIAYQRVPLPVKTGCKWTVEERKRNNSLSMKRSRVRNAEEMRIILEEYDGLLEKKKWLQEQHRMRFVNSTTALLQGHIAASQIVPVNQSVQPVQNGQEVQGVVPPPQFSGDGAAEHLEGTRNRQSEILQELFSIFLPHEYSPNPDWNIPNS